MAPFDTVLITSTVFGVPLPSAQFGPDATTIEPEGNGSRNWTMVSPILSYRLPCIHAGGMRLFSIQLARKSIKAKEALLQHARYEGIVDTIVQLFYSLTSGLIAIARDAR